MNKQLEEKFNLVDFIKKQDLLDISDDFILVNGEKMFFFLNKELLPTLHLLLVKNNVLKKVTVDMGAVKFVIKGADIMRPGIKTLDEGIAKDQLIVIVDETHGKPLAVGRMLFSGEEVLLMVSGKVIKNIHYIGDDIWK